MFTSWSATRLADYDSCPRFAKYKHLDKLCPVCFKGSLSGGFGSPVVCSAGPCHIPTPAAIARGVEIGESLEHYVNGESARLHTEVRHPVIKRLAGDLRKAFKRKVVRTELEIVLDREWRPVSKFTKGAWFRGKLDVFWQRDAKTAVVIDWKTGGIDKKTGQVRAAEKYDDQLTIYSTITLVTMPTVERTEAMLAFVDCGSDHDPLVMRAECNLTRGRLAAQKKYWEQKLTPMFSDKVFAPRPSGHACRFCPFQRANGGPCKY